MGHALEALGELAPPPRLQDRESRQIKPLRFARTCYNHLAGRLAVDIHAAMRERLLLAPLSDKQAELTALGRDWFSDIAGSTSLSRRDCIARMCLDWTERRHHLGGPLGTVLLNCLCDRKWMARMREPRTVRLTVTGRIELGKRLGLAL